MDADLDLLLTAVYTAADDLLPTRRSNERRLVTDAEVVTLAVAQSIMGVESDREFLRVAAKRLAYLFPHLPQQPGYFKRRMALTETFDWLIGVFASDSPGSADDVLLLDSSPVECARSRETVKRGGDSRLDDPLADSAGYGYCASHSRYFFGMRLHLLAAMDGTMRAAILAPADQGERDTALRLFANGLRGGETIVCDKGYAGIDFERTTREMFGATIVRPARKGERPCPIRLSAIRQRIESIFWTLKDRLGLERHNTRTLRGLRTRTAAKLLTLTASVWLNHTLGRPTRALANLAT